MKNLRKLLFVAALFFASTSIYAQAPGGFNYQAAIRDGSGEILANTDVNLRLSVITDSVSGTLQYRELQDLTTNAYGLVDYVVGTGTADNGTFSAITWTSGNKFLKVEVSVDGGPYNDMGTQQMVSVPFALEAKHAESADFATNATNATSATNATNLTGGTLQAVSGYFASNGADLTISPGKNELATDANWTTLDIAGNKNLKIWDALSVTGNVGLGTNPTSNRLQVEGNVAAKGYISYSPLANQFTNKWNLYWDGSNFALFIDQTFVGYFGITPSDRRLKENIKSSTDGAIDRIMSLKPVSFKYKNVEGTVFTGNDQVKEGFIADELQEIIPSAVTGEKGGLEADGSIKPQSVNVAPIVSVLTKAMQEQQAQIEALTKQVESLTTENSSYKAEITLIKDHLGLDLQGKK